MKISPSESTQTSSKRTSMSLMDIYFSINFHLFSLPTRIPSEEAIQSLPLGSVIILLMVFDCSLELLLLKVDSKDSSGLVLNKNNPLLSVPIQSLSSSFE